MTLFKRERLAEIEKQANAEPTRTVMIVDDEDGNLRVLRSMLADRFRVLEASDGRQAMEILDGLAGSDAPCVILSDQRMPRMTGVELFEQVRDKLPEAIRIIITGFVDVGAIVDAINRAGIYKFVVKPFDRNDLLLTVERAVEAYELRRQVDDYVHQLEEKVRERTRELEEKHQALQQAYAVIERASLTDPLTGLGNRRFLQRSLEEAARESDRRSGKGSRRAFLLVDIDHFKAVNDNYGHAGGDAVLATMGGLLQRHCREGELAVRWGGEEFLLQLAVDDEVQALRCADRLRAAVEQTEFPLGDGRVLRRTCSIGVACHPFDPNQPAALDWERTVALADAALYRAKRGGRNAAVALALNGSLPDDLVQRAEYDLDGLLAAGVLRAERAPV